MAAIYTYPSANNILYDLIQRVRPVTRVYILLPRITMTQGMRDCYIQVIVRLISSQILIKTKA